jgi:hypothetical protein
VAGYEDVNDAERLSQDPAFHVGSANVAIDACERGAQKKT